MKKTKIAVFSLVVVMVLALFVGCQQSTESASEQPTTQASAEPQKSYTIGVCAADLSNPYFVKLVNGIQDEAEKIGNIDVNVVDPKQDASKQADAVENFISQKVDAIIIVAVQPESVESYLKDAMDKGIKVLAQSTQCDNCDVYV